MFITKDAHRPTLTIAINFGDTTVYGVKSQLASLSRLAGIYPNNFHTRNSVSVKTVADIKQEIQVITKNKKVITEDWVKRLPKLENVAADYVVLYNIERVRVKKHENFGTTAYIYIVERKAIKNVNQRDATFVATIDPKFVVPDLRAGVNKVIYQFVNDKKVYHVKSKTEAERHSAQTGLTANPVKVFVSENGRIFPIETEITDFIKVDLYSGQVHFEKNATDAEKKFGVKGFFKTKIESVRNHLFFNVDVKTLKAGHYKATGVEGEQILVVDEVESFSGKVRSYHLVPRADVRLKKLKDKDIIVEI